MSGSYIAGLVDFILSIAALLLWLNWRGARFDPITASRPATLTGTLRRAEPLRFRRWLLPFVLLVLLVLRGFFYRQLGPAVEWTAALDLGPISISFRSDRDGLMLLYSVLSFLRVMAVFYLWMIFLSVINHGIDASSDPIQKLIRMHLGFVGRWPRLAQLLTPLFLFAMAWIAVQPVLVQSGVIQGVRSYGQLPLQGLLVGGAAYLSLKYLIVAFLLAHLVTSYVYLGKNPLWDFVSMTARNFLKPLQRLPLQIGKVDLAPILVIVLVLLALEAVPNYIRLKLDQSNRTIWPQ